MPKSHNIESFPIKQGKLLFIDYTMARIIICRNTFLERKMVGDLFSWEIEMLVNQFKCFYHGCDGLFLSHSWRGYDTQTVNIPKLENVGSISNNAKQILVHVSSHQDLQMEWHRVTKEFLLFYLIIYNPNLEHFFYSRPIDCYKYNIKKCVFLSIIVLKYILITVAIRG